MNKLKVADSANMAALTLHPHQTPSAAYHPSTTHPYFARFWISVCQKRLPSSSSVGTVPFLLLRWSEGVDVSATGLMANQLRSRPRHTAFNSKIETGSTRTVGNLD